METVTYVFSNIPFLDSHNPYFFIGSKMFKEKALEIIYLNMEELKPKFRLRVVRKIMIFDIE